MIAHKRSNDGPDICADHISCRLPFLFSAVSETNPCRSVRVRTGRSGQYLRTLRGETLTYPSIQSSGSTSDSKMKAGHYRKTDLEARYIRLGAPLLGLIWTKYRVCPSGQL